MSVTIRIKRGTATQWEARTTPLLAGEFGYDLTNKIVKIGDGTTLWSSLPTIGSGGNGSNTADFIFTNDTINGQSVISLPGDKQMRIDAGDSSDLYLTAGDDIYIQTTGTGDDIHINAADDIRFSAGDETASPSFWRMDSEGLFQLPGDGYISNPIDSSGDINTPFNDTIHLVPDSSIGSDQYIILDPTAPNHIHIRAGGNIDQSGADLILGGEKNNVVVSDSARDVFINTRPEISINSYTNLSEVPGINFIVVNTADISVGHTVNVDGTEYLVDSVEPFDEGSKIVTASGASFTAGEQYTFFYNPEYTNSWEFGSDGYLYGPAEGGLAVLGISNTTGTQNIFVTSNNKVLINGANGEFLNDTEDASKQIATIGDFVAANEYTDLAIAGLSDTIDNGYIPIGQKATAGGVASLGLDGYVPDTQISPDIVRDSEIIKAAVQWTSNHYQLEGGSNTRYLAGDVVYDGGNIFVANFDNESLPTTNTQYWTNLGAGNRLNIDGRDIPNILWDNILNKPTLFSGSYNDLTDKPSIPADVSDLTDTSNLLVPFASPTFTGTVNVDNLEISGDLTFSGTATQINSTETTLSDPMIYLGEGNAADINDLGFVASFDDGTYQHAGLVRDASDHKWKLFKGVTDEPTNTVNFAQATLDDLAVGSLSATSATIGDVSNTELQYLNGVTSGIQSQIDARLSTDAASVIYLGKIEAGLTYAPKASPTFTGTVTFPANTSGANFVNIPNSALSNSSITINGSAVSLGGSTTIDALPSQSGNNGKYLTTNGSAASWSTIDLSSYASLSNPIFSAIGGDEGGQINFAIPNTNTTLSGDISLDIYQNRLRIFESSGNNRGAYLNIANLPNGVSSEILTSPSQSGQSGKFLTTDGTTTSWAEVSGGGGTAGADIMNIMEAW